MGDVKRKITVVTEYLNADQKFIDFYIDQLASRPELKSVCESLRRTGTGVFTSSHGSSIARTYYRILKELGGPDGGAE